MTEHVSCYSQVNVILRLEVMLFGDTYFTWDDRDHGGCSTEWSGAPLSIYFGMSISRVRSIACNVTATCMPTIRRVQSPFEIVFCCYRVCYVGQAWELGLQAIGDMSLRHECE